MSSDYSLRPPPRVSFATHDRDVDAGFKDEVLERVRRARWNPYVGLDQRRAAEAFADRLSIGDPAARRASLHRGAEAALRCLIEQRAPERLWAPQHGYPGFARVASSCRVPLVEYADAEGLEKSARGDLVIVTTPASPIAVGDAGDLFGVVAATGAEVVVDATFSLLDPRGVAELGASLRATDASLIVSASKSLGLAGIRLGILVDRGDRPDVVPNPMELDVFQCAVWETLLDSDTLPRRALAVGTRQRELHHRLRRALQRTGAEVMYASNHFAITIGEGAVPAPVLAESGWKAYPRLHAVRIDASERVVAALEAPT